ncbi:uncharacterized protein LOC141905528 isoform X1 [Tubulanus polymorphus]|uniref:uncharacterized protein LOC141905528 isoform X1 n=1 Tax=Tubulanus polymorphus TaxID=672921 RepID=UPI003DA2DA43
MSAKSTQRANTREKPKPQQQTQVPNKDVSNTKLKATAEQMRIAQIISDKTDHTEDLKLKIIKQVQEMTHKSQDEVVIVLHDCDFDMNKAINMLLEGATDQGEWHETGKKKKRVQQASVNNHTPDVSESKPEHKSEKREKSSDRDASGFKERSESSSRGRRNDAIPRFQRGGKTWRGKENEENDRNRTDSNDRGRGRGRGGRGGRGRGRGGGRGNRGSGGDRGGSNRGDGNNVTFDNGPQIDTWTNDQAVQKKNDWMGSGIEDWDNDTWTGNLNETKVFTATNIGNNPDSSPIQDTNTLNSMTNNSLSNSLTSSLTANLEPFNQTNSITQSLDLGPILQPKAPGSGLENDLSNSQTSDSLSRYTKQATESIKSIVGIGNSSSLAVTQPNVGGLLPTSMSAGQQPISVSQSPVASQRPKPQRSKLPPPSKIPASAVEMPGHMATSHMDVQFGFGTDQSTLSFGSDTSTGLTYSNNAISAPSAVIGNHMPVRAKTPEPTTTMSALLASITPPKSAIVPEPTNANSRSSVFSGSATSTPTKDYTQSPIKTGIAAPEPIPFPSPNDRKTSPMMVSQRPQSGDTATSLGAYSSSYPTSGYKNSTNATTTSGFTHSTNSLTSAPSGGLQQQQQQPTGAYPSSRTPYQSGYQSFQNQSSLYQNNSQSTYGAQNSSYQRDSSSYSSSQPGSYQGTQNQSYNSSQSASTGGSYAVSQSSAAAAYQSGQSSYNTTGQSSTVYPSNQQPGVSSASYAGNQAGGNTAAASYPHAPNAGAMGNFSSSNQSTAYSSGQSNNAYQSSHSVNSYPASSSVPSNSNSTYPSRGGGDSSGQSQTTGAAFGSYGPSSAMNAAKLGETLSKMGVKDNSLDSTQTANYEHSTSSVPNASAGAVSTPTPPSNSSAVNNASNLGLTTSSVSPTTATSKISNTATTKAPPNLPPGVPLTLGPNFIMGQHGMPQYFGLQQPMYSYEDLQLLQQRLPLPGYYETSSLPFQPPTSLSTNRDQTNMNNTAGVQYSGTDGGKMSRVDAQSPVQATQQNTQQQQQPTQSAAHQQTYISPGALPPGYGYYYPGGIMPGSFQYTTPAMFPVPQTNAPHAANTSATNAQFQKQPTTGYGTHAYGNGIKTGYDDLAQPQDFSKTGYNSVQHSQNKAGGVAGGAMKAVVSTAASDMSGTAYGKSHTQVGLSFDKQGFHAGTPPPFNLAAMQSGTQGGPMAPTNPYAQFVPMMTHHSQLMHHQLQQDASSGSSRGAQQQTASQVKPTNKNFSTAYWSN